MKTIPKTLKKKKGSLNILLMTCEILLILMSLKKNKSELGLFLKKDRHICSEIIGHHFSNVDKNMGAVFSKAIFITHYI